MQTPDSIEAALSRLMPPALSESGQRSIEAMLDELAVTAPSAAAIRRRRVRGLWWFIPTGIAAALAAVAGLALQPGPGPAPVAAADPVTAATAVAEDPDPGLVLVSESSRVEQLSDEGLLGNPDGEAMRAVRCRVVDANTFRDEETGIVVQVTEPREETILMPVSIF